MEDAPTLEIHCSTENYALRPESFNEFVGQSKTLERLSIMARAAKKRGEAMGHILLSGPPGLGKTTLSMIVAKEAGRPIITTSGPVLEKPGDLAGVLTNLQEGDILFVDEIHRISKTVEEYLYSAMEDFRIDIMIDQGPNARSIRLDIPRFTMIGATTRSGMITAPLRSRFTLHTRLEHYTREELALIVQRSSRLLGIEIEEAAAQQIASRSRGTPRIANNLIRFARDCAQDMDLEAITDSAATRALDLLAIDSHGLNETDTRLLKALSEHYNGGPVGLKTLSVVISEEEETLEEVHEPYLIQEGYIQRTALGRVLTLKGRAAIA